MTIRTRMRALILITLLPVAFLGVPNEIGLPDLDGYGLARRLRSEPATARIRLIALVKPVEFAALEALLRQLAAAA